MSQKIKNAPAVKAASGNKPPKKLIPRMAPGATPESGPEVESGVAIIAAEAKPVVAVAQKRSATGSARKPNAGKRARKVTPVEETVARHQKELAEALVMAQAISYDQPSVAKPAIAKPGKAQKVKLVRDSYAMPESEYAQIGGLKKRLVALGKEFKKSELLRGGIAALVSLNDAELQAVMGRIERIKTGRPAK